MRIEDEIRVYLKEREHLLVHFNTNMAQMPNYPADLQLAVQNPQWMMASSSVGVSTHHPTYGKQQTMGEVGLILDICDSTTIHKISMGDAGSNGRLNSSGAGPGPSIAAAAAAIDREDSHDEWVHTNMHVRGIFCFGGFNVWNHDPKIGNISSQAWPPKVAEDFPEFDVFSIREGTFQKWNSKAGLFQPCTYQDIIA